MDLPHGPDGTELLYELGNAFPNGLAFDPTGRLVWMELHTKRVVGVTPDGGPEMLAQLGAGDDPDGCAYAADGRLVWRRSFSGGLEVVEWTAGGTKIDRMTWTEGAVNTNCCFRGQLDLGYRRGADYEKPTNPAGSGSLETTLAGLPL